MQNGGGTSMSIDSNPERLPFEGAGFIPRSEVEIKITDEKNNIKYTTNAIADNSGNIEGEISIKYWDDGTYVLHAKGKSKRDGCERTKHIKFEHFREQHFPHA